MSSYVMSHMIDQGPPDNKAHTDTYRLKIISVSLVRLCLYLKINSNGLILRTSMAKTRPGRHTR